MHLRPATPNDLALLTHWDTQAHVIEADPNDDWQWATELSRNPYWRAQLIAQEDERPVGFVQILDPAHDEERYWGEGCPEGVRAIDIWIGEAEDLGKGYGTRIMELTLKACFSEAHVTTVWIDPLATNTRAIAFYKRLGFVFVEERHFGQDHCAVYHLERARWEAYAHEKTTTS